MLFTFSSKVTSIKRASQKAVAKFLSTERKLQEQNEKISKVIDEVSVEIAQLEELRASALVHHQDNTGIIQRIGQIVRGGTNDGT